MTTQLSYFFKTTRDKLNLTQKQMALELDVSLDAIKKIEAGNTHFPSTKVLAGLAKLTSMHETDIIQEIIFNHSCYNGHENDFTDCCKNYLAYLYINGYSINKHLRVIQVVENKQITINCTILSKKTDSNYKIGVDTCNNFFKLRQILRENINQNMKDIQIFTHVVSPFMNEQTAFKEIQVVFNSNSNEEIELYKELCHSFSDLFNLNVYFVLYNDKTHEIESKHKFS